MNPGKQAHVKFVVGARTPVQLVLTPHCVMHCRTVKVDKLTNNSFHKTSTRASGRGVAGAASENGE